MSIMKQMNNLIAHKKAYGVDQATVHLSKLEYLVSEVEQYKKDIGKLFIEREELKSEVERLREEADRMTEWNAEKGLSVVALSDKLTRAEEENRRLTKALQNIRKRCFNDSEWGRYIDAVLQGGKE